MNYKHTKKNKTRGEDGLAAKLLKYGGEKLIKMN